jgi:eukaryotic-like serine/threonine-protein kinase
VAEHTTLPWRASSNGGLVSVASQHALPSTRRGSSLPKALAPPLATNAPKVGPGDWIGSIYRIESKLGGGAMGQVFSAFDDTLERRVAIKLIAANLERPDFRKRFMLEARAMALVSHPNVLSIYALGERESSPFIVMELVEGQTLDRFIAERGAHIDLDVSLRILNQICLGVSAIHAAGTLHRDIKPSNILLHHDMRVRVSDLGLAVGVQAGAMVRELVGTPGYIAPEIQLGAGGGAGATPQSDLYSLGCLAYELLTSAPPFSAKDSVSLAALHACEPVPIPSRVQSDLPAAFDEPLLAVLAKTPNERPASVEAFRTQLLAARRRSLEPRRILVADDDADFRELLELVLKQEFPAAQVECFANGKLLVEAFDRQVPSVVVLDLHMPELDGLGCTALLRAKPSARLVPIIIMTAMGGPREWELLSSLGADRFLVKPISMDDLVSTIRRVLRERSSRAA